MKIWKWHFVHQHFKQNFCERLCRWVSASSYSFYGTHDRHTKHQNVDYNCFHELGKRYSWIGLQGSVGKKSRMPKNLYPFLLLSWSKTTSLLVGILSQRTFYPLSGTKIFSRYLVTTFPLSSCKTHVIGDNSIVYAMEVFWVLFDNSNKLNFPNMKKWEADN